MSLYSKTISYLHELGLRQARQAESALKSEIESKGLVLVGIGLYAPKKSATLTHDTLYGRDQWKLLPGKHATYRIEDGKLVPISEKGEKTPFSPQQTQRKKYERGDGTSPTTLEPTPVEEVDLSVDDFIHRADEINTTLQRDPNAARPLLLKLAQDYDLYIQGEGKGSLRSARHHLANFPRRNIYGQGDRNSTLRKAVIQLENAIAQTGVKLRMAESASPLSPTIAMIRPTTDTLYGIGQKKVEAERDSGGLVTSLVFQWDDQKVKISIDSEVEETELAIAGLSSPFDETPEEFHGRKTEMRRSTKVWQDQYALIMRSSSAKNKFHATLLADIYYSDIVSRNEIIRTMGTLVQPNGHMDAAIYYGEPRDVIEACQKLISQVAKIPMSTEHRERINKFLADVQYLSTSPGAVNIDATFESLWTDLVMENIPALREHYAPLVESLTGIRELIHSKITIFPHSPTNALADCYAISRLSTRKTGIAVNSDVELWNVKFGEGSAASMERRFAVTSYIGTIELRMDNSEREISSFEVRDDLVKITSSETFGNIFEDCDDSHADIIDTLIERMYTKYASSVLESAHSKLEINEMTFFQRQQAIKRIRGCFQNNVNPKSGKECAPSRKVEQMPPQGKRRWQRYYELLRIAESVNNSLSVSQQFKSLLWREDKIIECDGSGDNEMSQETPYQSGAEAQEARGTNQTNCGDGTVKPSAKFQARTIPLQKRKLPA